MNKGSYFHGHAMIAASKVKKPMKFSLQVIIINKHIQKIKEL